MSANHLLAGNHKPMKVLGEVIAYSIPGGFTCSQSTLSQALSASGLDAKEARDLLPRHAFSRACRKLDEARIIRKLDETETHITFQFTAEKREADELKYDKETILELDKDTGLVSSTVQEITDASQSALNKALGERTTSDITRIVHRLFNKNADLFPIRDQGGCYFVPDAHKPFVDSIEKFLGQLSSKINRFPVPMVDARSQNSVRDVVESGIGSLIDDHIKAIDDFNYDTMPGTLEARAKKIDETEFKIEAYAEYLGNAKDKLLAKLKQATKKLMDVTTEVHPELLANAS